MIILKSGVTVLPICRGEEDITFSAIFQRVEGIKYRDEYNIYEYIVKYHVMRRNNSMLHYILSKYELNASTIYNQYWVCEFDDFELIQRDVLITHYQIVSLIPEWDKKEEDDGAKYYDLPDGSHLKSFQPGFNEDVDISEFVYAELARRGKKSARS
jgi:hypothetical protein